MGLNRIRVMREISVEWERLIKFAEILNYGEAKIVFQGGIPVRIDCAVKQIKLDDEMDFGEKIKIIPIA